MICKSIHYDKQTSNDNCMICTYVQIFRLTPLDTIVNQNLPWQIVILIDKLNAYLPANSDYI